MSTAIAKYGTTDLGALRAAQTQLVEDSASSRAQFMKLVEGPNQVRILPPWDPKMRSPFYELWLHYMRNPADPQGKGKPVACPLKMRKSKTCIACEEVRRLYDTGSKADEQSAKDLRSTRRVYANVVNMLDTSKGVQVLDFGTMLYEKFLNRMLGSPSATGVPDVAALGDISDPDEGYTMVIDRKGTKQFDTKYELRAARNATPIADPTWLTQLHDLSKIVVDRDNDYIRAVLSGKDPVDEAEVSSTGPSGGSGPPPVNGDFEDATFE